MSTLNAARQPDLVGRDSVRAAFDAALDQLHVGRGQILLVAGEPGIGKTSVLQSAMASARSRPVVVRWATCPQDDAAPPYWPLVQLLGHPAEPRLASALEQLTATADAADTRHRFLLLQGVASALRAVSDDRPQMLVIDDLQWADASTLRLLAFLVKQLATSPVLITGGYRDTDLASHHPLRELLGDIGAGGQTVTLEGLATQEVAELARRAGVSEPSTADAEHLRRHTGGNPFFALNAARLVLAEARTPGCELRLSLPVGVRAVLERRLARLSQPCHALLRTASVLGAQFDAPLLAAVSGIDPAEVDRLLAEAVEARLAAPIDAETYAFAHALVRTTTYDQIPVPEREQLHGLAADAARTHPNFRERLAEIAHHELRAGSDRARTAGVEASMAAGHHALGVRAFEEAAAHFTRASAATDEREQAVHARLAAGEAHRRAGDWEVANDAYLAAAADARALERADLLAQAALGVGADVSGFEVRLMDRRQLPLLAEALDGLAGRDPALESRLLARRAVAGTGDAPDAQRRTWAERAVSLARQAGDPRVLAYALSAWCDVHAGPSHTAERLAAADEMLSVSRKANDPEGALLARRFRVVALLEAADPAVHAEIDAFAREAEALGLPLYTWYVSLWRGMQALARGELDQALARLEDTRRIGAEAGSDNADVLASTQLSGIMFEQGQIPLVIEMYQQAFAQFPHLRESPIAMAMRPLVAAADGKLEQARAALAPFVEADFAQVPYDSEWLSTLTALAQSIFATRDPVAAAALYDVLRPYAGQMAVDGIAANCMDPVDFLLGRLAEINGNADAAIGHFEAAAAISRRLGAPLLVAHAEYESGRLRSARGDEQGTALMAAARTIMDQAGSAPEPRGDDGPAVSPAHDATATGAFRFINGWWELEFEGRTARLPDAKGLHDLRFLLAQPGRPVPAAMLQRAGTDLAGAAPDRGVEALDDHAREAYRRRLADLDADIQAAEDDNDGERAATAREERDFLVAELSAAVGLGGRARRIGDDRDRARKAVTMRIRNAISRIDREHPALARHLDRSIKTGSVCSYDPEHGPTWTL